MATLKYVSTDSEKLADALREFLRMYRPHEAREDTVLFPAFRSIVSAHEYDALGDDFEKKEDELFGDEGFFKVVDQVAELEKKLGIYELTQFTPKSPHALFSQFSAWQRCTLGVSLCTLGTCHRADKRIEFNLLRDPSGPT